MGTALLTVLPVIDRARCAKQSAFLMQLDVSKAYDSIDRPRMVELLTHLGLGSNKFI